MMRRVYLRLLGPYQATLDKEPVTEFRSDKVRALLAYLAMEADRAHRRDALAGLFWPNVPDRTARNNLRLTFHRLRQALRDLEVARPAQTGGRAPPSKAQRGPSARPERAEGVDLQGGSPTLTSSSYFHITRETLRLKPGTVWVDAIAFAEFLAASQSHDHRRMDTCPPCAKRLAAAVGLYRGDFLRGFFLDDCLAFSEWVLVHCERLHRQALSALHHLTEFYRRRGELDEAQTYARRQLELEPWREEAHRQLMEILARSSEISAALAQYKACQRVLAEELDIEPDDETVRLYQRIQALRRRPYHNLPPQATPFVGREDELARIADLLADPDCRLLTIVGPGGIGKTRLAIQAALALADEQARRFLEGVIYVTLTGVGSPDVLASAIAQALGFSFHGATEPAQQLINHLRPKEVLLLLDNFEHLIDGTGFLLLLLEQAPQVKLLVTSRERLNVPWEWVLPLEGLPFPLEDERREWRGSSQAYDAVRLFQASARRVQPGFRLEGETEAAVVRICRTVEGMPLGVELAAAWVGMLPAADIADEIAHHLDLSAAAVRHLPPRHRSLQAVFDHTWQQLTPVEQQVFMKLSVFRGGFQREAAAEVAGASPPLLASLVNKSLLRLTSAGHYEMHELLRQYAGEKLTGLPRIEAATRERHWGHYAAVVQRLTGDYPQDVLAAVRREIENVRAGWNWVVARGKPEDLLTALEGLYNFYEFESWYQEGKAAFSQAAKRWEKKPERDGWHALLAKLWTRQGWFCWRLGDYNRARGLVQQGVAVARNADDQEELAFALGVLGLIAHNLWECAEALRLYEESLAIYTTIGNRVGTVTILGRLALLLLSLGECGQAERRLQEALSIAEELQDRRHKAHLLGYLGTTARRLGKYDEAAALCQQGLALFEAIGEPYGVGLCLLYLGTTRLYRGEYEEAESLLKESASVFREIGAQHTEPISLIRLGEAYCAIGQPWKARRLYEASLTVCQQIGNRGGVAQALRNLGHTAFLQGDYGRARELLIRSLEETSDQSEDRYGRALTLHRLGLVSMALGDHDASREYFRKALAIVRGVETTPLILEVLTSVAEYLAGTHKAAQAAQLLALVVHHPASRQTTKGRAEHLLSSLRTELPADVFEVTQERGTVLEPHQAAEELMTGDW